MSKIPVARLLTGAILFAFVAAVVAFNLVNLNEAYGSGEPYYSRTTNMDKWSDPLPVLAVVDGVAVLAVAACFFLWRRASRTMR
ncbi:hypothetical protein GXB81_21225 [Paraburkholderia sp. Ac-20336]|uniref:hypothetical protein n=1 Tax=Burkholderiaceae TaxID=119060 RepID=UPI00141DAA56|nr:MULTISPECIES: hypothetical protein [Burkholderiaceae]MBN3805553.1 hypothetical protein [Paraburkholderia sp. Ac-20336]MBN3850296.1 hypothetical protein [Paraburkholderia sp. Ac-20342]NIF53680.1 hypothetical protein [Burkholderia sp. Ax-1724]NIF78313.1 hypothetical protein [Paraburkholderia sp. Cy-641]